MRVTTISHSADANAGLAARPAWNAPGRGLKSSRAQFEMLGPSTIAGCQHLVDLVFGINTNRTQFNLGTAEEALRNRPGRDPMMYCRLLCTACSSALKYSKSSVGSQPKWRGRRFWCRWHDQPAQLRAHCSLQSVNVSLMLLPE